MPELGVVHTKIRRAEADLVDELGTFGSVTTYEARARSGLLSPELRPIYPGASVSGTAVTVLLQPGDSWMMHVAAEQIRQGDIVVVALTSPCTDAFFGALLATSFRAQGARGLVIDACVRDVHELTKMGFPVWSRGVSVQGSGKLVVGSVNVPVDCGGVRVEPGDVIVADDDGVVCVPEMRAPETVFAARARRANERAKRDELAGGILGLDMYGMRHALRAAGLRWED